MIVFITTRGHEYTFKSLQQSIYGFPVPKVRTSDYHRLFRAKRVPRATYVFADLERLSAWELSVAAELHRVLTAAGLRCLNDPARAMARFELLRALHDSGLNPFNIYRADERPRPARFPVFVRFEAEHGRPLTDLLADQKTLEVWLDILQSNCIPLRGMVVVEYCSEPYRPGLWHKWSTFRVADRMSVDHLAIDESWNVKHGMWDKLVNESLEDEHHAVASNRFAADLEQAFDIAKIEFGRADHAWIAGRSIVYEINTNPYIGRYVLDLKPLRHRTQEIARCRLAEALESIDCKERGSVTLGLSLALIRWRTWRIEYAMPRCP